MKFRSIFVGITFVSLLLAGGCGQQDQSAPAASTPAIEADLEEVRLIAKEAYTFGFPFVANYRIFIDRLIQEDPLMMGAGMNEFAHMKALIPADTPDTAQRDTLYSLGIVDLRREPVVISVPDVADDQAYLLQMGDTSTESLPYISTLTTNNKAGNYVLVGPDYQGLLASGDFDGVITTRGQFIVMIGRIVAFNPDDLSPLLAIQDGMVMQPLSKFLSKEPPAMPSEVNFIPFDTDAAGGLDAFNYINMALGWHPAATFENEAMARFARIGVVPGQPFSTDAFSPEVIAAMEEGVAEANQEFEELARGQSQEVNGWDWTGAKDRSRFGTDYLLRAAIALRNIYPNEPAHTVYGQTFLDSSGEQLAGSNAYTLTFEAGELPPVSWFWSLTVYDAASSAMYPNPLDRVNISDRTKGLAFGDDGSLTIYIQHEEPEDPAQRANWLPAPSGEIYLVLRLYAPEEAALNGEWTVPPVARIR